MKSLKGLKRLARLLNKIDILWADAEAINQLWVDGLLEGPDKECEEEGLDKVIESADLLFEFSRIIATGKVRGALREWDDMYLKECIAEMLHIVLNEYSTTNGKVEAVKLIRRARELNDECAKMVGLMLVGWIK